MNLILATIYCPNGNPNLRLFETIKNLSDDVMFVGDFNSKLEAFGCTKKNTSGPMLKNIQNQLNLIYLNTDEHTHLDRYTGNTDILKILLESLLICFFANLGYPKKTDFFFVFIAFDQALKLLSH